MGHDIRPISESPTIVNKDTIQDRNSWKDSPKSSKGDLVIEVEQVNEKKEALRPTDNDEKVYEAEHDDGIDWKPGFKHQFPWIGFAGLMTVIIATALAVAILSQSHKKRVKDWPIERFPTQPNVLLNIANQIQNLGLITLIGQGLAIAWWRKALRGSSLKTLHKNHAYSYSFYAIITSGKHFNIIALAALMTKFAVIDSTLFQKATKTEITQQIAYANASVTRWIVTNWQPNRGGIPGDEGNIKTVDAAWASVLEAYNGKIANGKVHDLLEGNASFFDCPFRQECSGAIKGLGFAFNCSTSVEDVDYGLQRQHFFVADQREIREDRARSD
ncbi:Nn.00g066520.m01.CDS01 [Neocucurbitaria sp. VM-36]